MNFYISLMIIMAKNYWFCLSNENNEMFRFSKVKIILKVINLREKGVVSYITDLLDLKFSRGYLKNIFKTNI